MSDRNRGRKTNPGQRYRKYTEQKDRIKFPQPKDGDAYQSKRSI